MSCFAERPPHIDAMLRETVARHPDREALALADTRISYRTLEKGYDLAKDHPENWQDLLIHDIPKTVDPERLVLELAEQKIKVKEQLRIFERTTGLKRRSFFKYRSQANLTGSDDN